MADAKLPSGERVRDARRRPVILIAGATASGKSAVALSLAERFAGTVINADSMQLYAELPLLTARPTAAEEARVPHRLYGIQSIAQVGSVGLWLPLARAAIAEAQAAGRLPIVVGGTGLYLTSLVEGLASIPDVPPEIRAETRQRYAAIGADAFRRDLAARHGDAAVPRARDPQRLLRAGEVLAATGRPLEYWQRRPPQPPPLASPRLGIVLDWPRPLLYRRIEARFEAMLRAGVLEEVAALERLSLPEQRPALKALGLPELRRHLRGELSLEEASTAAKRATRRFAKRQLTWFRRKMISWNWIEAQESEQFEDKSLSIVRQFLLTLPD